MNRQITIPSLNSSYFDDEKKLKWVLVIRTLLEVVLSHGKNVHKARTGKLDERLSNFAGGILPVINIEGDLSMHVGFCELSSFRFLRITMYMKTSSVTIL